MYLLDLATGEWWLADWKVAIGSARHECPAPGGRWAVEERSGPHLSHHFAIFLPVAVRHHGVHNHQEERFVVVGFGLRSLRRVPWQCDGFRFP